MKRTLALIPLACAAMILTGCMSDKQAAVMKDAYSEFVHQDRSMPLQTIEFTDAGGTITYTNVRRYETRAPLDKLSIMPDNPGVARELVDGAVRVGTVGAVAYGLHEMSGMQGNTTINNAAATP